MEHEQKAGLGWAVAAQAEPFDLHVLSGRANRSSIAKARLGATGTALLQLRWQGREPARPRDVAFPAPALLLGHLAEGVCTGMGVELQMVGNRQRWRL